MERKLHRKQTRFLTGRQVAWIIHEYFKVQTSLSWTSLKVELKNDNVQLFNTRWDETIIAMKKQFDDEFYDRLLQQSKQLKQLLSLRVQDIVQKGESRNYTRQKKMVKMCEKARLWRCCCQGQVQAKSKHIGDCAQ